MAESADLSVWGLVWGVQGPATVLKKLERFGVFGGKWMGKTGRF
jgi:hypothetical protein